MKTNVYALVTNTAKRIAAAAVALVMLPGMLSYELVYAAQGSSASATTTSVEAPPSDLESLTEPEGITVWKDGKKVSTEATTGQSWTEQTIEGGGDDPTEAAPSVEEFTSSLTGIEIKDSENLYSLTAATGLNPGTCVEYFAVRYKVGTGDKAVAQTKYLFPKIHTLSATNDYIKGVKGTVTVKQLSRVKITGYYSPGPRVAVQQRTMYYDVTNDEQIEAAKAQFLESNSGITSVEKIYKDVEKQVNLSSTELMNERHSYLASLNYKINENTLTTNALSSWGVDEFLFKTDQPITEITGVEAFMSNGKWTVQGLSVGKVKKIGGYNEYGFYSGKYYLSLEKEIICQLTKKKSGTLTLSANGDTLVNIGGDDSDYFELTVPDDKLTTSLGLKDVYSFRIDIADTLDGGLESLLRNDSKSSDPAAGFAAEDIALEIEYRDTNGWTRNVTLPVLTSVIGQYKELSKKYGYSVRTIGLAQRGDTLAFTACLPDYASLISTKIYLAKAARDVCKKNCGLDFIKQNNVDSAAIAALDSDYLSIAGVSIYKGTCCMSNTSNASTTVTKKVDGKDETQNVSLNSYNYAFAFSEKYPQMYFTTTSSKGYKINAKTSDTLEMSKYKKGDPLIAAAKQSNFMVAFKTSSKTSAETSGDIFAQVFYQDSNGNEKSSAIYNVKKEVLDYLGYWPTKTSVKDNFAYHYGMSNGNYIEFPVDLPDAAAITNIEIKLDGQADEWLVESVCVSVLDGLGKRRAYAQNLKSGTASSPYRFYREAVKTVIPPFPIDLNLLFTPGETYSVWTGTGTIIKAEELDYNSVRYKMTYEQTQRDLGFIKKKRVYDVVVKVADDPDAGNINGDSGSNNKFYFQILFQNGSSGFVLANQQLSSDGFRAGQEELFSISVNRNYGEVREIRIIPEDTSEDNEIFDKLNIEYMTVTEQTNGGTAMQYVFDDVGWIDIDYHDKSEENTSEGRTGRSIKEISKRFQVSYQRSVINLLCEITADPWEITHYPFEASISATVDYIDTKGEPQSKSFDVISRMYEYMNKTPQVYSAGYKDDEKGSLYKNMGSVSDPDWMLRPNHTDRFILPALSDVKTLTSITFYAVNRSKGTAYWNISGLSISRINSDSGSITLNNNNEYLREMQTVEHCTMDTTATKATNMTLPAGAQQKLKVKLTKKDITWAEDKSWVSAVERKPTSSNDTLNVYVYPTENSRNIEGVSLSIAAQYTMPNTKVMQVKQNEMKIYGSGTSDACFYYTGLSANNMQNLVSLRLSCRSTKTVFTHAIVEQVREDVVVSRYVVNYGESSAMLGLKAAPASTSTVFDKKKQKLIMSFGTLTNEANLIAPSDENSNVNDIAIAIRYTSTLDHGANEYMSPYIYLGDLGIKKITPGMMVEIPFEIPYLQDIVEYRIGMFGSISAEVRGALAFNYSYTDKAVDEATGELVTTGDKLLEVYSFDQRFEVPNYVKKCAVSKKGLSGSGSVSLLDLNITTAEADAETDSGTSSAVEAVIHYLDHKDAAQELLIDDLRTYIQTIKWSETTYDEDNNPIVTNYTDAVNAENRNFSTGKTARVRMFIADCKEITAIELKTKGSWKISKTEGSLLRKLEKKENLVSLGEQSLDRTIDAIVTSEGEKISFKDVTLTVHITAAGKYKGTITKQGMSIVVQGESIVSGQVVGDKDDDYDFSVKLLGDGDPADMPEETYSRNGDKFAFSIPKNSGSVQVTYVITVWSTENPNEKRTVTIAVPVPEKEETPPDDNSGTSQQEQGTADSGETQTGDNTASGESTQSGESTEGENTENKADGEQQTTDEQSGADDESQTTDEQAQD